MSIMAFDSRLVSPRYQPTIREMPLEERPRERMRDAGPASLSNGELLAILLRTGSVGENVVQLAGRLLTKWGGLPGLARVGFTELCAEHGMGEAKTCQEQSLHSARPRRCSGRRRTSRAPRASAGAPRRGGAPRCP